jgi:hypothetical protein
MIVDAVDGNDGTKQCTAANTLLLLSVVACFVLSAFLSSGYSPSDIVRMLVIFSSFSAF